MGRRSRKRSAPPPAPAAGQATAPGPAPAEPRPTAGAGTPVRTGRPASVRARLDEAPPAPWAPVPLVELCVLAGLVLIVVALVRGGDRAGLLLACGVALASLAGLELSIREHFAGYRSHTTVLAGAAAVLSAVPLFFFTGVPQPVLLVVAVLVFAAAYVLLRRAFRARSGGVGFRA
ncbi:MAG TPA: hypothetical protein VGP78_10420 [Solirubrobacteraceae bacterium]|nr:hypothetical protein [Solirubrobacteraceae bacterium]